MVLFEAVELAAVVLLLVVTAVIIIRWTVEDGEAVTFTAVAQFVTKIGELELDQFDDFDSQFLHLALVRDIHFERCRRATRTCSGG